LNAKTPEERKFAADFLMMQFSSAQPNPSWGPLNDDSYGDSSGWWWGSTPIASYEYSGTYGVPMQKLDPLFVNAAQKTQVQSELKKLAAIGAAPNYFVKSAMAWAKAHPNDPRVPQALHFAVKSTRYGITDDATSALSKQAFALLHKNYKNSPWTKKTPYYF
jgi:hypothetical protein